MISFFKKIFWQGFTAIDAKLKFPALKAGDVAIQCGFDMSAPVTSDLFLLCRRINHNGLVIGIDPDPDNHRVAKQIINKKNLPVRLVQKALYSESGKTTFVFGRQASWNQLGNIAIDSTVELTSETTEVDLDTLDHLIEELQIDVQRIGHINLTINGAEYFALKGMHRILSEAKNICLTVVAGRYDESGTIDGRHDHELITELLHRYGFKTKFKRKHQLFWWGFVVNFLVLHRWVYNKKNYGILMACKGNKKIPWHQSFS